MSKFKIGDKVRRINYNYGEIKVGDIFTVKWFGFTNSLCFEEVSGNYDSDCFELVKPETFIKSDLQSGMKVIHRNGSVSYILGINLLGYDPKSWSGNGGYTQSSYLDRYKSDLRHVDSNFQSLDIVEVYERDGTLLWKRVEKSQQEIEYEKLKEQVDAMTKQMIALGKTIGK